MEIVYFDIDALLNDLKSQHPSLISSELMFNEAQKESLVAQINAKLFGGFNGSKKSVLILIDNFHYFFTSAELSKLSLGVLNEMLAIKKKQEYKFYKFLF